MFEGKNVNFRGTNCSYYFCLLLKAVVGEGSKYFITTERLASHCPVHGCKDVKTSIKTAVALDVRSSVVWPSSTSIDFQKDQTYQSPREDIHRFTRRGPGQWSLRLDKSSRENSGQTTRKLPDNFLPDLPEYFKRANSQSSFSTTKTSHADLSLKKNINLSFSSAVTLQVINNYQH